MGDVKAKLSKSFFMSEPTPLLHVMSFGGKSEFTNGFFAGPERSTSKGSESDLVMVMCHSSVPVSGRVLMGASSSLIPHDSRLEWILEKDNNRSQQLLAKGRLWSSSLTFVYLWQKWSIWLRGEEKKTFLVPIVPSHLSVRKESNDQQRFLSLEIHFDTSVQWPVVNHLASLQWYL